MFLKIKNSIINIKQIKIIELSFDLKMNKYSLDIKLDNHLVHLSYDEESEAKKALNCLVEDLAPINSNLN